MPINTPPQITVPFATSGLKNAIPATSDNTNGKAGYNQGFPASNMTPRSAGGIPPFGQDFNGILFDVTTAIQYLEAGGLFPFSASFAASVGGYPIGAVVLNTAKTGLWQNQVANNSTDPDAGGAGWVNPLLGRKIATQIFSTVGTFTYTPTPGAKTVKFTVQAGGARGGNTTITNSTQISVAPGGGAGSYAIWEGPVATAAGQSVVVGSGGNQSTPGGGTSLVGSLAVAGGGSTSADGAALAPSGGSAVGIPGNGGVFTVGDARSGWGGSGLPCFVAQQSNSYSGDGGRSLFGSGGRGQQANQARPGEAAVSRGAGGGGAAANISQQAQLGGNGAPGIVIAEEFS